MKSLQDGQLVSVRQLVSGVAIDLEPGFSGIVSRWSPSADHLPKPLHLIRDATG